MAYYNGNQYMDNFDAVDFSIDEFENGFAPVSNNMRPYGAYGTGYNYVPTNGGVYNALPQQVSGLAPPMTAGNITSQQPRLHVTQHPGSQGVSTAYGHLGAPMQYGMYPSMPTPRFTGPLLSNAGFSMVSGPQHAPQSANMQMGPAGAHQTGVWAAPLHQAVPQQRPGPVFAPTQMGCGATFTAPTIGNASVAPAPRASAPSDVIDLTNDDDDEPVGTKPTTKSSAPAIQHAGTKRPRVDSTSKKSSRPDKKPRYTRMEASALPTPPRSSSAVQSLPSSSPASSSSVEVLPVTPSPVKQQPTPRKKRADPHNLLGSFHYTYIQKPVNRQLAGSGAEKTEKITRPVYSGYVPTPQMKRVSKTPKTPEPAVVPPAATDDESDAEFELDDEYVAPPKEQVTSNSADSSSDCLGTTSSAEEGEDELEQIAFDDDGNVIRHPSSMPMSASETASEFDELVLEPTPEANTISPGEQSSGDADELNEINDADLQAALSKALAAASEVDEADEDDEDDEDDDDDDDGADLHAALTEAFEAEESEAGEVEAEEFQAEESEGEISEDES